MASTRPTRIGSALAGSVARTAANFHVIGVAEEEAVPDVGQAFMITSTYPQVMEKIFLEIAGELRAIGLVHGGLNAVASPSCGSLWHHHAAPDSTFTQLPRGLVLSISSYSSSIGAAPVSQSRQEASP